MTRRPWGRSPEPVGQRSMVSGAAAELLLSGDLVAREELARMQEGSTDLATLGDDLSDTLAEAFRMAKLVPGAPAEADMLETAFDTFEQDVADLFEAMNFTGDEAAAFADQVITQVRDAAAAGSGKLELSFETLLADSRQTAQVDGHDYRSIETPRGGWFRETTTSASQFLSTVSMRSVDIALDLDAGTLEVDLGRTNAVSVETRAVTQTRRGRLPAEDGAETEKLEKDTANEARKQRAESQGHRPHHAGFGKGTLMRLLGRMLGADRNSHSGAKWRIDSSIEPIVAPPSDDTIEEPVEDAIESPADKSPTATDDAPVAEEPVVEEPVVEEPVEQQQPVAEEPVVEEPIAEQPAVETPTAGEEPITEEPIAETPSADHAPVAEETTAQEPPEEPIEPPIDEATPPTPPVDNSPESPVVEEPVADETGGNAPIDHAPRVEDPVDESVSETPNAQEAVAETQEPAEAVDENAVEEPEEESGDTATTEAATHPRFRPLKRFLQAIAGRGGSFQGARGTYFQMTDIRWQTRDQGAGMLRFSLHATVAVGAFSRNIDGSTETLSTTGDGSLVKSVSGPVDLEA